MKLALLALSAGLVLTGAASAQTTITKSETAQSGKSLRIAIVPALKKDCSVGPMPEFRVDGAPKNGATITKIGKQKTPGTYRCPNKETPVVGLFYQSKAGFTGQDEIKFEIKTSDGQTQTQNIKITVESAGGKPGGDPKKDSTDL